MARPRKNKELGATAFIGIRISPELRERLERIAASNDRLLAEEVRRGLEEYAGRSERKIAGARSA